MRILPAVLIEAPDKHGPPMPIEPGLDTISYVSRPVDLRIFVVRNAVFLSPDVPNEVCCAFHGLHLAHQRSAGLFTNGGCRLMLHAQGSGHDSHPKMFLRRMSL
jgi:hypothetical protein